MRKICILGSTGSIGRQTLDVIRTRPDRFSVFGLVAGHNVRCLAEQCLEFEPSWVSVLHEDDAASLQRQLRKQRPRLSQSLHIGVGNSGAMEIASHPDVDCVLSAIVGAAGLRPTLAAIQQGHRIALANKESLVMAGELCMHEAKLHGATLIPVDSEHSAIFQALLGHGPNAIQRLILTGSGGPLRENPHFHEVTLEQVMRHPTWSMGRKITIDSATLMNKGLEMIAARWLFDVDFQKIDVLIHAQSIVHSLVEYVDGSVVAQLAMPDMRIPIAYALTFPERLFLGLPRLDLATIACLSFAKPDLQLFPCLAIAYDAIKAGGTAPAAMNAANEVAVDAFLRREISFSQIPKLIEAVLVKHAVLPATDLAAVLLADEWARVTAGEYIEKL